MSLKILCVDDEAKIADLFRQKFRKQIRQNEMEFIFAENGLHALETLKQHEDISLVFSDIFMPKMDGLTLLEKLQELKIPNIRVIMVSAYGDMPNIRTAMNRGAFDFITKPIDFEDLEITLKKTIADIEAARQGSLAQKELSSIKEDLNVAQQIQLSLVPKVYPPFPERKDIELHGSMDAAKNIGGDLYDFFFIDQNRLGIVIGDVAGKGIPAALFMALSRTIIRVVALKGVFPDVCMQQSNDLLSKESVDSMFVTVFYGILDTRTGDFLYCNGGHNPPYILKNDGKCEMLEQTEDSMLGFMDGIDFHTKTIQLQKGESVYMYSDGVTEAMNKKNEEYTEKRLEKVLQRNYKKSLEEVNKAVVEDVKKFTKGAEQSDDITMLSLRYL